MNMEDLSSKFKGFAGSSSDSGEDIDYFEHLGDLIDEKESASNINDKLKAEMELLSYFESLKEVSKGTKFKFGNLSKGSVKDLEKIEGYEQRRQMMAEISVTEEYMRNLKYAGEQAKKLHIAYEEFMLTDKRIHPEEYELLSNSLKPFAQKDAFAKINQRNGLTCMIEEYINTENNEIKNFAEGDTNAVVKLDNQSLEVYIKEMHTLEVIFFYAQGKIKESNEDVMRLRSDLIEMGGKLKHKELQEINSFMEGNNPKYLNGGNKAVYDFLNILAKKFIKD